jgi:hypothetical protein
MLPVRRILLAEDDASLQELPVAPLRCWSRA